MKGRITEKITKKATDSLINRNHKTIHIYFIDPITKKNVAINGYKRLVLQFFPDSIREELSNTYTSKDYPTGDNPIYQWINTGARTLSFTVYLAQEKEELNTLDKIDEWNVDVMDYIMTFRQSMLSRLVNNVIYPPVYYKLLFPSGHFYITRTSKAGVFLGKPENMSIEYKAFFENGAPKIATIDFSLTEVIL